MSTLKFCSVTFQHMEWLSKNRLADPVTQCSSSGYLLGALCGGFHANFDGATIEAPASDTGSFGAVVTTIGDLVVCDSTANKTVARLANGGVGTVFVGTTAAVPKYLAAPAANGALLVGNSANDPQWLAAGAAHQILKGVAAGTAPAWKTVDYTGNTGTGGTVGQIAIAGMTANGAVVVTALEDLGVGYVISHVICGVGIITVYQRDVLDAGVGAATAIDSKKVAVHVIKLDT